MAQYSGKVDDYLQATSGALEVAVDTRYLPIYDPEAQETRWFKIDTSDRGSKEIDKLLAKTNAAVENAQADLVKLVEKISDNGGGIMLQRRPKVAKSKDQDKPQDQDGTASVSNAATAEPYSTEPNTYGSPASAEAAEPAGSAYN